MTNLLVNFLYHVSSWVIIFLALSLIAANFYPLLSKMIARVNLEYSAFYVLTYSLLAPLAASIVVIVLSLPEFAFSFVEEHCHGLDCSPHGLQVNLSNVYGIAKVSFLVGLLVCIAAIIALQLLSNSHKFSLLDRLAESTPSSYKIVDSKFDLAWCSGLIRPKVFVSRGLTNKLTEDEMQVVLAHEHMHIKRKDNLRKWCLHWATIAWPRRLRQTVRVDLLNYTEQICDLGALKKQNKPDALAVVLKTLKTCYAHPDPNDKTTGNHNHVTRARLLELAWKDTVNKPHRPALSDGLPSVFMVSLLFVTVILSVRIGHPILEWLAL